MNKSLILKIATLVIILIGGQGVFWFFKTSATKKHIMAMANSSDGGVTISKISVAGFPLSQKIVIDDIKFQADAVADKIALPNKYQINIKHLEAVASVFSNDFKATISGPITLQDANGVTAHAQFKQEPIINLSINKNGLQKLSYQDSGYKITDEAKNTLYESGNSAVDFESAMEGENKIRGKIKADFNDIEGIDIFTNKKILSLINPSSVDSVSEENLNNQNKTPDDKTVVATANKDQAASSTDTNIPATIIPVPDPANPSVAIAPSAADSVTVPSIINGLAKKSIHLEIEYVMAPKSEDKKIPEGLPNVNPGSNANLELASVDIKNLEFSSPLYKIKVNGGYVSGSDNSVSQIATCDLTIKVENINNILTYIKKAASPSKDSIVATATAPVVSNDVVVPTVNPPVVASVEPVVVPIDPVTAANTPSPAVPTVQPTQDVALAIMDLAKKNAGTKDELAIFRIKKEKDSDLTVNDVTLVDLEKIFPSLTANIINEGY